MTARKSKEDEAAAQVAADKEAFESMPDMSGVASTDQGPAGKDSGVLGREEDELRLAQREASHARQAKKAKESHKTSEK